MYDRQDGEANVFRASFTPLQAGTYTYRYGFTTNIGIDWVYTSEKTFTLNPNTEDTQAPAKDIQLVQPEVESGQVNLLWSFVDRDDDDAYMLVIERNGQVIHTTTTISTSFTDYDVENGKHTLMS